MAKRKPTLDDIFQRTELRSSSASPTDLSDLELGLVRNTGVALREGEIQALDRLGETLGGISRNKLIRFAVRDLLIRERRGDLELSKFVEAPDSPKPSLRFPGEA